MSSSRVLKVGGAVSTRSLQGLTRVAIVTPASFGELETFIRAHVEKLPFDSVHIHGSPAGYVADGIPICQHESRGWVPPYSRLLSLLPEIVAFRIRRRFLPAPSQAEEMANFLRRRGVDLVIAEYGTTAAAVLAACKQAQIPLIAHFHGFDASRNWVIESHRSSYPALFDYCSSVIVVSKAMREQLIRLGCPAEKLVLSHYGPDPAFFHIQPDYHSPHVIAVGRLTEKKAPYLTIAAFKEALGACPDIRLTLVGDGELRGICRDLIHSMQLQDKVTLWGKASPEVIRDLFSKAFLFVQHSITASDGDAEGTPVAILEAGAAGLPVVSTRHAGIPDVVIENETGFLVSERDISTMAKRIVALASDRVLAERLGRYARVRVASTFSQQKHLDLISEAVRAAVQVRS